MTYSELYSYAKIRLTEYEAMCMIEDIFGFDRSKLAIHGNEIPENEICDRKSVFYGQGIFCGRGRSYPTR